MEGSSTFFDSEFDESQSAWPGVSSDTPMQPHDATDWGWQPSQSLAESEQTLLQPSFVHASMRQNIAAISYDPSPESNLGDIGYVDGGGRWRRVINLLDRTACSQLGIMPLQAARATVTPAVHMHMTEHMPQIPPAPSRELKKRFTPLLMSFTHVRTRTLLRPIDQGNNIFGSKGTEKCSNCRRHHQKVLVLCSYANSSVFTTMRTINALIVCERIWIAVRSY
jgi:hypothetical protein